MITSLSKLFIIYMSNSLAKSAFLAFETLCLFFHGHISLLLSFSFPYKEFRAGHVLRTCVRALCRTGYLPHTSLRSPLLSQRVPDTKGSLLYICSARSALYHAHLPGRGVCSPLQRLQKPSDVLSMALIPGFSLSAVIRMQYDLYPFLPALPFS